MTRTPTFVPTPAPSATMDKLSNIHYIFMLVTVAVFSILTVIMRLDMPDYQRKRVGYGEAFVVIFALLDFVGDVAWSQQRFHAYYRGDEPDGLAYGIWSLTFTLLSTVITGFKVGWLIYDDKALLKQEKLDHFMFITMLLVSATNPDAIIFFPWTEDAYKSAKTPETPFPNDDALSTSLWKMVEDVPEFIIQMSFFSQSEWDSFTAANLAFTFMMLLYLVIGKLLKLWCMDTQQIVPSSYDPQSLGGDVEMPRAELHASIEHRLQEMENRQKQEMEEQRHKDVPIADASLIEQRIFELERRHNQDMQKIHREIRTLFDVLRAGSRDNPVEGEEAQLATSEQQTQESPLGLCGHPVLSEPE